MPQSLGPEKWILQNHNIYLSLFEHSPIGIAVGTTKGELVQVNPRACEMLGHTKEELEGHFFWEFDHPDDRENSKKILDQLLNDGLKSSIIEKRYIRKDGTIMSAETTVSLLLDEAGEPAFLLAMIKDMSAIKDSQLALLQKEELLQKAVENTGVMITLLDLEGVVLYVNRLVPSINKEEFVNSLIYKWLTNDRIQALKTHMSEVIHSKKAVHYESTFTDPVKKTHYFYHVMSPIFNGEEINSVSILSTEITERKELERKLNRQKDLMALGLDAAEMGVWEWDIVNDKLTWDDNTQRVYGWEPGTFPGTSEAFIGSMYEPDRLQAIQNAQKALESQEEAVEQFRIKKKNDQQIRWISSKSKVFRNEAGKAIRLLGITWDCTKEKEREIERIKSIELERQNTELKEFSYLASHDLKEPLRTVNSYVQLLSKRYKEKLDTDADLYLNFISSAVHRMRTQIQDLLDYSLIGQSHNKEIIDCNTLVKDIQNVLSLNISEVNATFEIDTLPEINGYKTELSLLFQNLIGNALKFHREGVNPHIKITVEQKNAYWKFKVQDNGIGVEDQYQEKIFLIFQRLHTREAYEGTGIGLAHCRKIVELHGGEIWVEPSVGVGSSFCFTIQK